MTILWWEETSSKEVCYLDADVIGWVAQCEQSWHGYGRTGINPV